MQSVFDVPQYIIFLCFLFRAHWYLVVICFPGLDEPKTVSWNGPNSHSGTDELQNNDVAQGSRSPDNDTETPPTPPTLNPSDTMDTETGRFD